MITASHPILSHGTVPFRGRINPLNRNLFLRKQGLFLYCSWFRLLPQGTGQ